VALGIFFCIAALCLIEEQDRRRKSQFVTLPSTSPATKVSRRTPRPTATSVTVTPKPVNATFETVCDPSGGVIVQGFLHLPETASCDLAGKPATCTLQLNDPVSDGYIPVVMPMPSEMPGTNYPQSDKLWLMPDFVLSDGEMVEVRGSVRRISNADDLSMECELSLNSVRILDEFTLVDWHLPQATLRDALDEGLIGVLVTGHGLTKMNLKIEPKVDLHLELEIEQGTIFESQASGVQNMVVRKSTYVHVKPGIEAELDVDVSCADMEKKQPTASDSFTVGKGMASKDLLKLLRLQDFVDAPIRIQQFAVWTITDNPTPDEYVSLSSGPGPGHGPSPGELGLIKNLFIRAGIDVNQYQALLQ
jgi:hypothetical protein